MKRYIVMRVLISIMIMMIAIAGMNACGRNSKNLSGDTPVSEETEYEKETEESKDIDKEEIDDFPAVETVDAIDMEYKYEGTEEYYDEEEGYKREATIKGSKSLKFVDYDVIDGLLEFSYEYDALILHFKATGTTELYNADGTRNDELKRIIESGPLDKWYRLGVVQNVKNKDTGEIMEKSLSIGNPHDLCHDNALKWREEKGISADHTGIDTSGEGWRFPDVTQYGFDNEESVDYYYVYQLVNKRDPIYIECINEINHEKQYMTITF